MRKSILFIALTLILGCKNENTSKTTQEDTNTINVIPISHGTLILEHKDVVVYIDPVGGTSAFEGQKSPTHILITDIHGDHLNIETLEGIVSSATSIVAPNAVYEKLTDNLKQQASVLSNSETKSFSKADIAMKVEAIPMYNLREEAKQFHTKGRGNGYVINLADQRIYISGDTEDIPEMRALKNIDKAFVCMNLPWTMTVESAADAVLEFQPKTVYPYHYRGNNGLSDVEKFKDLVTSKNETIAVRLLNWYPDVQ